MNETILEGLTAPEIATPAGVEPPTPIEVTVRPEEVGRVALEAVVTAVAPLLESYLQSEERKQLRHIELEEETIRTLSAQNRAVLWAVAGVVVVILLMAGVLILRDRVDAATGLLETVTGLAGAAIGGWGLAKQQKSSAPGAR